MRELRFRAWDGDRGIMLDGDQIEESGEYQTYLSYGRLIIASHKDNGDYYELEPLQYTGLNDKNGVPIFEGDLLRVKVKYGDNAEFESDAVYECFIMGMSGIELAFRSLHPSDAINNQYPIHSTLSERYRTLDTDSRGGHHDRLAVPDTYGENTFFKNRWRNAHYSSDIEVIGNIHQRPELLK